MICRGCGRSVAEDALVCDHCGRQLTAPEECRVSEQTKTPPEKRPKEHLGHKLLWAVPVLLVAIVGVAAWLLLREPPAPTTKTVYLQTEVIEHAFDGATLESRTMEYDNRGRLLKAVETSQVANVNVVRTITYEYEGDRVTKAHVADGKNSFLLVYDYEDGKLTAVETEKSNNSAYIRAKCDRIGHITRLYYFDGGSTYKKHCYTYHANGMVATCTIEPPLNSDYKLSYSYDTKGNLTEQSFELQGKVRQRITYDYDEANRLTLKREFTDANSQLPTNTLELTYETNDAGLLTAVHIFRTKDHDAVSLSLRGKPKDNRVELKPVDAAASVPKDLRITVAWDDAGNITEEKVFCDGIYVYYRTYKYQAIKVPSSYVEPTDLEPRWLMGI